jgi:hypothetical protein
MEIPRILGVIWKKILQRSNIHFIISHRGNGRHPPDLKEIL